MKLIDKVIPVKGKFIKETRGYREADIQDFIDELKIFIPKVFHNKIDELSGFVKYGNSEVNS